MESSYTRRISKFMLLILVVLMCACKKDDKPPAEEQLRQEYRIAIVLPTEGAIGNYWKKSIDWALESLNKALILQRNIKVTAEWYNEEQSEQNLKVLFNELANRKDICAIIGPLYTTNAKIAATECYMTSKTLIPATISSESFMRQYSGKDFLWCLAENDISQCEVMLTRAKQKGAKSVSLLTSDDEYGQTFIDWFAFQAKELELTVKSIEKYNADNVTSKMNEILMVEKELDHCLLCIPNRQNIAEMMNTCRRNQTESRSLILFSDIAYIIPKDTNFEGMEGIAQTHDPESGFSAAYEAKYGTTPGYGSAHYYDAVTLAGLAILHTDLTGDTDLNASLKQIVTGEDDEINTCSESGIRQAVESLIAGKQPHCAGASGKLRFDQSVFTNVLHSVYCHWQVYNGKHQILEYNTSDSSKRTDASMANWNWKLTQKKSFTEGHLMYYPKDRLCVLIIAASSGWNNYRHQANAYAMYQLLKKNGVDDDDILLISEDDIAWNSQNPKPGFIQSSLGDENLYKDIKVDYPLSEVPFEKLTDLVTEHFSDPDPKSAHHLFVYWAGHGEPEGPKWGDEIIPPTQIADFFKVLRKTRSYIKAFMAMDTSYAGQVGKACYDQEVPYLLCMTATNENETSKASMIDASGQVWISNSFTDNLLQQLISDADKLNFYNLYNNIYDKTIGSHVTIYFEPWEYGRLSRSYIKEFFYP